MSHFTHFLSSHVAEPQDYTLPASFSVTFSSANLSANVAMLCVDITIVEDSDVECDHDFTVGIESISPTVNDDLSSSITVNIDDSVDGEPPTRQLLASFPGFFTIRRLIMKMPGNEASQLQVEM